jgi:hypothetical protein
MGVRVISQPVFVLFLSRFMLDRSCTFYWVFIIILIVILHYTWVETSVLGCGASTESK